MFMSTIHKETFKVYKQIFFREVFRNPKKKDSKMFVLLLTFDEKKKIKLKLFPLVIF